MSTFGLGRKTFGFSGSKLDLNLSERVSCEGGMGAETGADKSHVTQRRTNPVG